MELLLQINSCGQAFCRTLRKAVNILMPQSELSFPKDLVTANVLCLVHWEPVFRYGITHCFPPAESSHQDKAVNFSGAAKYQTLFPP